MLEQLTRQLAAANALTDEQVRLAVERLVDEAVPAAAKAEFLTHLALKGETTGEIAAFARELRAGSIQPVLDGEPRAGDILDVVGTGGDRSEHLQHLDDGGARRRGGGGAGGQARQPRQHLADWQRGCDGGAGHPL